MGGLISAACCRQALPRHPASLNVWHHSALGGVGGGGWAAGGEERGSSCSNFECQCYPQHSRGTSHVGCRSTVWQSGTANSVQRLLRVTNDNSHLHFCFWVNCDEFSTTPRQLYDSTRKRLMLNRYLHLLMSHVTTILASFKKKCR